MSASWLADCRCGRCGGTARYVTNAEAETLLGQAVVVDMMRDGKAPLDVIAEFPWEAIARQRLDGPCTCPPARKRFPSNGFYLYRLWGEDDRLLYVGVSRNLDGRVQQHTKRWGSLIKSVTWQEYNDASAMFHAEKIAIRDEMPPLNIQGVKP